MKINIKTTTITLTPAISEYIAKRLDSIEKLFKDDTAVQCDVELAKTTNHHNKGDIFKAEIHIVGKGENIYANVEKEDLYVAIDLVRDEVVRKIVSVKEKHQTLVRKGGAEIKKIIKSE